MSQIYPPGTAVSMGAGGGVPAQQTIEVSPIGGGLDAVPAWASGKRFTQNQLALSPSGAYLPGVVSLIQATTTFTSGGSFSPGNWNRLADIKNGSEITYRGAWQASTLFYVNDAVIQSGALYVCTTQHTSGSSFSGADWTQLSPSNGAYAAVASIVAPPLAGAVTQNKYARTQPTPNNGSWSGTMRALCKDPNTTGANGTGRVWYSDQSHDYIAYTDDDGTTGHLCGIQPDHSSTPTRAVQSLVITTNYFWLSTVSNTETPCSGRIWRAPYSSTPGTLTWTLIYDMNGQALGTGGAASTGNTNGGLRNSSFAVASDESTLVVGAYGLVNASTTRPGAVTDAQMTAGSPYLYSATGNFTGSDLLGGSISVSGAGAAGAALSAFIVEILSPNHVRLSAAASTTVTAATITFSATTFGAGVVVGGPQLWVSANPTVATPTFTLELTLTMAKHIHAVKYINGVFWMSAGDLGRPFTDQLSYWENSTKLTISHVGLWNSTTKAATTWNRVTQPGLQDGQNMLDPISFVATTVAGQAGLLCESDTSQGIGPLWFGTQTQGVGRSLNPSCKLPWPYLGTMRQLGIDSTTGNAYWMQTGESGGVGPLDTIVMAASPYSVPIVLESAAANTTFTGTFGDPVISNGYFWIGLNRCAIEKIVGQ